MAITLLQPFNLDTTANYTFNQVTVSSNVDLSGASNVSLGAVGNVKITGGTSGQYLITDGAGNLSFTTLSVSSSSISNGNSNVNIPAANGNINLSVVGNANVLVVTGTGINVAGTINSTGNLTAINANLGNAVVANYFSGSGNLLSNIQAANITGTIANANYSLYAGTLLTNAQPNITSVGTLTSLTITGNVSSGNADLGNLVTANYTTAVLTTGAQPNITSTGTLTSLSVTGNISSGNANLGNLTVSNYFSGNGSLLTSLTGGNVTGQVANALIASTVYTAAQPNITSLGTLSNLTSNGTIDFTNASNVSLGAVGNVKITGGTANYVLSTDGAGNLSWVAQSGGGGSSISNGTSNINIATANGNITMSVNGNANIVTVTGTGINIAGTANLGNVGNVKITGGTANYILKTDGAGNLSWSSIGNIGSGVATVDSFTGNGVQTIFTLSVTPSDINYTTVNYDGVILLKSDYTLSGADVTLSNAPANGSKLEVTTLTPSAGGGSTNAQDLLSPFLLMGA